MARVIASLMFALVRRRACKGLLETTEERTPQSVATSKERARQVGVRGETYAYWYLRRQGYTCIARNYAFPGFKGELDIVAYDGPVLAFIEVKTRTMAGKIPDRHLPSAEDAVNYEKRRNLTRIALQFMRNRRIGPVDYRFDILAIEAHEGASPGVRLHKNAFRNRF